MCSEGPAKEQPKIQIPAAKAFFDKKPLLEGWVLKKGRVVKTSGARKARSIDLFGAFRCEEAAAFINRPYLALLIVRLFL